MTGWSQSQAVELARKVEAISPEFGAHVALTGGCLYKDGERKDCDLLFYRIRQVDRVDQVGLFAALRAIGVNVKKGGAWVFKAEYEGRMLDLFFPEERAVISDASVPRYTPRRFSSY